ncbi:MULTISPECIES: hypothetical protein [Aeromonas]|uniref:hypothetical protein n=1 Tax=Aeromonas TaxID=642 RepID=UPI0012E0A018|nr:MULTISPECIES: hypothetical protein [Aeromonas]
MDKHQITVNLPDIGAKSSEISARQRAAGHPYSFLGPMRVKFTPLYISHFSTRNLGGQL